MSTATRTCRDCGAPFTRSPADVTVRCPSCRSGRRRAATAPRHARPELCSCGKTVFVDGFGSACSSSCPQCGDEA